MSIPGRTVVAALAIAALVAAGCGSGSSGKQTGSAPTTIPTSAATSSVAPNAASQSPADARRDGVVAQLAALPFAVRVRVLAAEVTPEGVWVLSRPTDAAKKYADGCRLGPETGEYPTTTICTTEYGEVLLLDANRERILRAYPLPSVPPTFLRVTDDAVYCGRQGDTVLSETTLPDTMACRIDRKTLQPVVRVFAPGAESEVLQPCFAAPRCWQVEERRLAMTDLQVDKAGVWAGTAHGTWTRLDPKTLAVVATNVTRAAASGG